MKGGMQSVLEEVISDVLKRLPPTVPEFKKITGFSANYTIGKTKRNTNGSKARKAYEMECKSH